MKQNLKLLLSPFVLAMLFFSCSDNDANCTDKFEAVSVRIFYSNGLPVILDKYKVMWGDRDIAPKYMKSIRIEEGTINRYIIVNDEMKSELKGKIVTVTFLGYIGEKEVVNEDFKVGADECHVTYEDSKSPIITIEKE